LRNIITVDGLAGSGKTTLARLLASRINYVHLNSGLLYRGLGWLALSLGVAPNAEQGAYLKILDNYLLSLVVDQDGTSRLKIGKQLCGDELFEPRISDAASRIAPFEGVRERLLGAQREAFPGYPIVAEGRDMGTIVFPTAPLKFFIVAQASTRAARRLAQLIAQRGEISALEKQKIERDLELEIAERDRRDRTRLVSPTIPAQDAIELDNSVKTLTEMVEAMYSAASSRGLV
jgi:CMP/dCMP kinase